MFNRIRCSSPLHCNMSTFSLSPHRARLVAAALLAAPPANSWVVPVPVHLCSRRAVTVKCQAHKSTRHSNDFAGQGQQTSDRLAGSNRFSSTSADGKLQRHKATGGPVSQGRQGQQPGRKGSNTGSTSSSKANRTHNSASRHTSSSKPSGDAWGPPTGNTRSSRERSNVTASSAASSSSKQGKAAAGGDPVSSPLPERASLLVVGAGAAGLTAAFFAAQQGAQVVVLERTREAGKKVLMSGGTRCNVLPLEVDLQIDYFTSSSRSALRAAFSTWTLEECHDWLSKDIGLPLVLEEETRKWFPASNSGQEVRDQLVAACRKLGVQFVYYASVEQITPPAETADPFPDRKQQPQAVHHHQQQQKKQQKQQIGSPAHTAAGDASSCWRVGLASGQTVQADRLVLSTGGYSFPAVGTDGTGLRLLTSLGHRLSEGGCYAALTPLKGPHPGGEQLAGLTLSGVRLSVLKPGSNKVMAAAQRGGLLFTHKGYSGPAVLDVSHWLVQSMEQQRQTGQQQQQQLPRLVVDWTGEGVEVWHERLALGTTGGTTVNQLLRRHGIKERLAHALASELGVTDKPVSQLKKSEREQLLTALTAWQLPIQGHEGYPKAEVTGGGVPLEQVDVKTMESRFLPGLYLCGEVLDVFGRIGGFNFWWAWLSGRLAGRAAGAAAATASPRSRQSAQVPVHSARGLHVG